MKSRFLFSILGLQILVAFDTVCAADGNRPVFTTEELDWFSDALENYDPSTGGGFPTFPAQGSEDTRMDGNRDISAADAQPVFTDEELDWFSEYLRDPRPSPGDLPPLGDETRDEWAAVIAEYRTRTRMDGNSGNNMPNRNDDEPNDPNNEPNQDTAMDGVERGGDPWTINDFLRGPDQTDDGNDLLRWSPKKEDGGCGERTQEIERALKETTTLSKNAMTELDVLLAYRRTIKTANKNPDPKTRLYEENRSMIVAAAHFWGMYYNSNRDKDNMLKFNLDGLPILAEVKKTYGNILGNVTTEREGDNRFRLICGDAGVELRRNAHGTEFWWFKHFRVKIRKEENDPNDRLCHLERNTVVFFDDDGKPLIVFCDSIWNYYPVTLDGIIAYHGHYVQDITLDYMKSLGGVMMHVLMHALHLGEDVEIDKEMKPIAIDGKVSPGYDEARDSSLAWSYYWCVALTRLDVEAAAKLVERMLLNNDVEAAVKLGERMSLINIQNYIWFSTWATLKGIEWWKRSKLPHWSKTGTKTKHLDLSL